MLRTVYHWKHLSRSYLKWSTPPQTATDDAALVHGSTHLPAQFRLMTISRQISATTRRQIYIRKSENVCLWFCSRGRKKSPLRNVEKQLEQEQLLNEMSIITWAGTHLTFHGGAFGFFSFVGTEFPGAWFWFLVDRSEWMGAPNDNKNIPIS